MDTRGQLIQENIVPVPEATVMIESLYFLKLPVNRYVNNSRSWAYDVIDT
ncbi:hypothetical protein GO730_38245 [Spirosoma sp. HMF3257]|nr:hypothetical protein [Spirosoma telluris]